MSIDVKICGLSDAANVTAAVEAGANFVGFVFHPGSRRFISAEDAAKLAKLVPKNVKRVGLFVDASDEEIQSVLRHVPLDMLQLHGGETPTRVKEIKALTGLHVIKALGIASAEDLKPGAGFEAVADWLLFDTRVAGEAGGTGKSFDWNLLRGRTFAKPWMLAGGLNASNLAEAVRITGAKTVDVSSGVGDASGQKDPEKIREFIAVAQRVS